MDGSQDFETVCRPIHRKQALALIAESNVFPAWSPDWEYRRRAAWKLDQMARGVPSRDWTDLPQAGLMTLAERMTQWTA